MHDSIFVRQQFQVRVSDVSTCLIAEVYANYLIASFPGPQCCGGATLEPAQPAHGTGYGRDVRPSSRAWEERAQR